jgi:hypothetical protein
VTKDGDSEKYNVAGKLKVSSCVIRSLDKSAEMEWSYGKKEIYT